MPTKEVHFFDEDSTVIANIGLFDYPVLQAGDIVALQRPICASWRRPASASGICQNISEKIQ